MAVVQISKIQVRRGRKNTGSGIPQLASGEFGWAVDSQELYIGNGAVSEGSPAVGNTKVLTENDNLFTLADQYTYKAGELQTGATVSGPIKRTLQERLDDIVSIRSFGGTGDGTDQTAVLQRAIDQLYINTSTKGTTGSRVKLHLEAGTYVISNSLKIPPHASIIGAGADKTIIKQTSDNPIIETVNGTSTPGSYADNSSTTSLNQARRITIEGITLESTTINSNGLKLVDCKDSIFKDLIIKSTWTTGITPSNNHIAVTMTNFSSVVGCFDNVFDHVEFQGWGYGITSDYDVYENTFSKCLFTDMAYGVHFGANTNVGSQGQQTGPEQNTFENSIFRNIDKNAIIWETGSYNVSLNNKFINIGNNGGTSSAAAYSIIKSFVAGNTSTNDWFSRTKDLSLDVAFDTIPYISEIEGPIYSSYLTSTTLNTNQQNAFETIFKLPGDFTRTYLIDYQYKSNQVDAMRQGTLEVIVNKSTNTVTYTDTYDYNGEDGFKDTLELKGQLLDVNGDTIYDTVGIKMKNTVNSEDANFTYKVKIKS